jgi:hypothetical protein
MSRRDLELFAASAAAVTTGDSPPVCDGVTVRAGPWCRRWDRTGVSGLSPGVAGYAFVTVGSGSGRSVSRVGDQVGVTSTLPSEACRRVGRHVDKPPGSTGHRSGVTAVAFGSPLAASRSPRWSPPGCLGNSCVPISTAASAHSPFGDTITFGSDSLRLGASYTRKSRRDLSERCVVAPAIRLAQEFSEDECPYLTRSGTPRQTPDSPGDRTHSEPDRRLYAGAPAYRASRPSRRRAVWCPFVLVKTCGGGSSPVWSAAQAVVSRSFQFKRRSLCPRGGPMPCPWFR